jgi:hypothetical protein
MFACTAFVSNSLGQRFVEPPMLDLGDSLSDSVPHSPLLFILSAGNNQRFSGSIFSRDPPSVSKSNHLHVDIFQFRFIKL